MLYGVQAAMANIARIGRIFFILKKYLCKDRQKNTTFAEISSSMKRVIAIQCIFACLAFLAPLALHAQTKGPRHEISFGWGDQCFEKVVWHQKYSPSQMPGVSINYQDHFRYFQHWFVDCSYRLSNWLSMGVMADVSGVRWDEVQIVDDIITRSPDHHFCNISLLPQLKFHYFNRKHVSFHSSLAAGMNINTGSEIDFMGRKTAFSPSYYLNPFGVRGMYDNFFAQVDLGALVALEHAHCVYMMGSRLVSVSVGFKF